MIKINKISVLTFYLKLTKQMNKWKNCNRMFLSSSSVYKIIIFDLPTYKNNLIYFYKRWKYKI